MEETTVTVQAVESGWIVTGPDSVNTHAFKSDAIEEAERIAARFDLEYTQPTHVWRSTRQRPDVVSVYEDPEQRGRFAVDIGFAGEDGTFEFDEGEAAAVEFAAMLADRHDLTEVDPRESRSIAVWEAK